MNTEPAYRLVADENEPITMDMAAATPRDPRRYEQDPLAANMSAAQSAAQIIMSDTRDTVRDDSERMQDLVSDMFHLADLLGVDMDNIVDRAQRNYEAEIRGVL